MCRTRRIKVRQPHANASPAPQALVLSRCPPDLSCSAMRLSLLVFNARSLDANVQDIRMTSTLSFVMKPKPRRGGLAGQSIARRSNFRLSRGTATKLTVRLYHQEAAAIATFYLALMQHLLALFQAQSVFLLKCKQFTTFFQTTYLSLDSGRLEAI